jgi:hypothetical protein
MNFLLILTVLFLRADTFSHFTYCHETTRGLYELQCTDLDSAGKGQVQFKRRAGDPIKLGVTLSPAARDRFLSILEAANYLDQADTYEAPRKVADLGKKRVTIELTSGAKREGEFNYSMKKEVNDLMNFCEGVINEEMIGFDIDNAIQYDRLSIPKRIDLMENELKSNRIADPERLIPILDKIQSDQRLINYARARAGKMKEQILNKKSK